MQNKWRPIDTAPKNYERIIGYIPGSEIKILIVRWTGWGNGSWDSDAGSHYSPHEVTHWMRLPGSPEEEQS